MTGEKSAEFLAKEEAIKNSFLARFRQNFQREEASPVAKESVRCDVTLPLESEAKQRTDSVSEYAEHWQLLDEALEDTHHTTPQAEVPVTMVAPVEHVEHPEDPAQQALFAIAADILRPGQLCKVVVRKPGGAQWELCQRKYDTLKVSLAYRQPLRFSATQESWILQAFADQEMVPDTQVERVYVHRTEDATSDYRWVELWTTQQNHCVRFYPLPAFEKCQWVTLSTPSRKVFAMMTKPLQLHQALFDPSVHQEWLRAPVERIDPIFDIEKRVRSGAPLLSAKDSFRVFLKTRDGLLKARLDFTEPLKIPLDENTPLTFHFKTFLASFSPYWISVWERLPQEKWYFSCRFENPVGDEMKLQVFGLQWQQSVQGLAAWVFTRHGRGVWTAHGLKGVKDAEPWCPDALVTHLLLSQPLALNTVSATNYFLEPAPIAPPLCTAVFKNSDWQRFAQDSGLLSEIFVLLQQQMEHHNVDARIHQTLQYLLTHSQITKPAQRLLLQRFEEYCAYAEQAHQHADLHHYIQAFWQTLFQTFFESLFVPEDFMQLIQQGEPHLLVQNKQCDALYYFTTQNSEQECLWWSVRWDVTQQIYTLLDINQQDPRRLPAQDPAFDFMAHYRALPLPVKTFIEPYWRYFSPMAALIEKGVL